MQIVVVGAGPAGMMLAHILAKNGVAVRVFERHPDFHREFRGEVLQPSALKHLDELKLRDELAARGILRPAPEIAMYVDGKRKLAFASEGYGAGGSISQPRFLELVDERTRGFASYRLDWNQAVELRVVDGRVGGVVLKSGENVDADLVVVCAGRNTPLRKQAGLAAKSLEPSYAILWLRFDKPSPVRGLGAFRQKNGFFFAYSTSDDRVQLAWSAADADMSELKTNLSKLRERFVRDAPPQLRPLIDDVRLEDQELQVLRVICDRLERWHVPGALLIGDAAHTMSPVGAQGVNIAIRDAVVAANEIISASREGRSLDDASARVQDQRMPEVVTVQRMQSLLSKVFLHGSSWRANVLLTAIGPLAKRFGGESPFAAGTADVSVRYA